MEKKKTVKLSPEVIQKLAIKKAEMGFKSYDALICYLVKRCMKK